MGEAARVLEKQQEKPQLKSKVYKVDPKNWVGAGKGKPMTPRMVAAILEEFPERKFVKLGDEIYLMEPKFEDGHLTVKIKKAGKDVGTLKGWYNLADELKKRKIGVYNLCRSIREVLAQENGVTPNQIKIFIEVQGNEGQKEGKN